MKTMIRITAALLLGMATLQAAQAADAGHEIKHKEVQWPFDGMMGTVDRQAAQRGYQVYKEVCAACHSLHQLSFRNLTALGFSEAEVKAIASGYNVTDGPNDMGEMFDRPALPSDRFVSPYPNENAARASNNGAYPPDLSLMVKARPDGANYLYSLLTGYEAAPANFPLQPGMNYNKYFPGHQIAMPQPLSDNQLSYMDGTPATLDQMAKDVTIFLQWAAEPEMEQRKQMGINVLIFLAIMTGFFYVAMNRVWRNIH